MVEIVKQLKAQHFKQMAGLEALYYSGDFITTWKDAYDWYTYSEDTCMAAADEGTIVGFMNLFPIADRFYRVVAEGGEFDGYLDLPDVLRIRDGDEARYQLFLSCVVVHQDYRKTNALGLILSEYLKRYEDYRAKGAVIDKVITHNVTEDGRRFSEKMGFKLIKTLEDGTTIAEAEYDTFIAAIERLTQHA